MRTWAFNITAIILMVAVSSKITEKLVDKYFFYEGATKQLESANKSEEKDKVYKSKMEIDQELNKASSISEQDLKIKHLFSVNRNYFIQVLKPDARVHDHYYHMKQLCWKKGQPLFLMKIDPKNFQNESAQSLLKVLHIDSLEQLLQTEYILVNEDGIKLPFESDEADAAIAFKFLQNPLKIESID